MLDKKLVAEINRLAALLEEIKNGEFAEKYPNLVEVGKKALQEQCDKLEKELEYIKNNS